MSYLGNLEGSINEHNWTDSFPPLRNKLVFLAIFKKQIPFPTLEQKPGLLEYRIICRQHKPRERLVPNCEQTERSWTGLRRGWGAWTARGSGRKRFLSVSVQLCKHGNRAVRRWMRFRPALTNKAVTSPMGLFKFKLIKINKVKNLAPQSHISSAREPRVTSVYCTGQFWYETRPPSKEVLSGSDSTHNGNTPSWPLQQEEQQCPFRSLVRNKYVHTQHLLIHLLTSGFPNSGNSLHTMGPDAVIIVSFPGENKHYEQR